MSSEEQQPTSEQLSAELKAVESSVSLIRAAADLNGIKISMSRLSSTIAENVDDLLALQKFQSLLVILGETVKRAFTDLSDSDIDSAFEIFDSSFAAASAIVEAVVTPHVEEAAGIAGGVVSTTWIQRGLVMKQLYNDFITCLVGFLSKNQGQQQQVKERAQKIIKLLLSVAFFDNQKDVKLQRNPNEIRIALDMTVRTCFDLPTAVLPVLTTAVNTTIDSARVGSSFPDAEAQNTRVKSIISTIQDLVGMTVASRRENTTEFVALICSALQSAVSSLILPHNDWNKELDLGAWAIASAMAEKNNMQKPTDPHWTNGILERFFKDAEEFLSGGGNNNSNKSNNEANEDEKEEDDDDEKAAPKPKPKGKKAAAKKAAPKKPAAKKGKKAAKVEEEEEEEKPATVEENPVDADAAAAATATTGTTTATALSNKKLVLNRAMMLLETLSQASTRGLKLRNLCRLGLLILHRLADEITPVAESGSTPEARRAHALLLVWRQLQDLIRFASCTAPTSTSELVSSATAENNNNDKNEDSAVASAREADRTLIQSFINQAAAPAVRFGINYSAILAETGLFCLVLIRQVFLRVFTLDEISVVISTSTSNTAAPTSEAAADATADVGDSAKDNKEDNSSAQQTQQQLPSDIDANAEGALTSTELQTIKSLMFQLTSACEARASMLKRVLWILRTEEKKVGSRNGGGRLPTSANNNNGDDDADNESNASNNDEEDITTAANNDDDVNEIAAQEGLLDDYTILRSKTVELSEGVNSCLARSKIASVISQLVSALNATKDITIPKLTWQMTHNELIQKPMDRQPAARYNNNNNSGSRYGGDSNNGRGGGGGYSRGGGGGGPGPRGGGGGADFGGRGRRGAERYGGQHRPRQY